MRLSVVRLRDGCFAFGYLKESQSGENEAFTLSSRDKARPEMIEAFLKLKEVLVECFSVFKFSQKMVVVHTLRLKYGGSGFESGELSGFKLLGYIANKDNDFCKIETDMITIFKDKEELVNKYIQPVLDESKLYIRGFRAQQQLFDEDNTLNDDADEGVDYSNIEQAAAKSHGETGEYEV